ncbi:hypothetical protein BDK51DRAFT_30696, partial [Blyttiomyces helicus]
MGSLQGTQRNLIHRGMSTAEMSLGMARCRRSIPGSLEKLCKTYAQKQFKKAGGDVADPGGKATYTAFATLVAETERYARSRGAVGERAAVEIADVIKDFSKEKVVAAKKHIAFGTKYNQELWGVFEELDKTKQSYEKAAKESESAEKKYEETSKKPNSGLNAFKTLVSRGDSEERVEKGSAIGLQLRSKAKATSRRLNDVRNEYVLAIESANAAQDKYYQVDLPSWMEKLDGTFYTNLVSLLSGQCALEEESARVALETVEVVKGTVARIDRSADVGAFVTENAGLFNNPGGAVVECAHGDSTRSLLVDEVTKVTLGQLLGRLIAREQELAASLAQKEKELVGLKQMADVYSNTPSFGNASSPLEQKSEIEFAIEMARASQTRVNAQIALLRNANVSPIEFAAAITPAAALGVTGPTSSPPQSLGTAVA